MNERDIITVGFDKNGEADFGVNSSIRELSYEKMKELRAMIVVAIGQAERMWRDENDRRNPTTMQL